MRELLTFNVYNYSARSVLLLFVVLNFSACAPQNDRSESESQVGEISQPDLAVDLPEDTIALPKAPQEIDSALADEPIKEPTDELSPPDDISPGNSAGTHDETTEPEPDAELELVPWPEDGPEDGPETWIGEDAEPEVEEPIPSQYEEADNFQEKMMYFLMSSRKNASVNYKDIDRERLAGIMESIATFDHAGLPEHLRTVNYIRVYNIAAIDMVLKHYPISSPLDVDGFFDKAKVNVGGEMLTLNELENKYLRHDPRIHFMLICAAKGCPKTPTALMTGNIIESVLEAAAKFAINDPDFVRETADGASISQIFEWYAEDFGGKDALRSYLNQYLEVPLPVGSTIEFYPYDWGLNE